MAGTNEFVDDAGPLLRHGASKLTSKQQACRSPGDLGGGGLPLAYCSSLPLDFGA